MSDSLHKLRLYDLKSVEYNGFLLSASSSLHACHMSRTRPIYSLWWLRLSKDVSRNGRTLRWRIFRGERKKKQAETKSEGALIFKADHILIYK